MHDGLLLTAEFVRQLKAQDRAAFCKLVQQFHRRLVGFAGSVAGAAHAEDIVQEAWLSAWKALPGFEGRSELSTWLYTIVRNACIARLRKERPHHAALAAAQNEDGEAVDAAENEDTDVQAKAENAADGVDEWFEQGFKADGHWQHAQADWHLNTPEALLEESQLRRCLEHHISKLQPNQRAVFQMRDMEQLELDDICNILRLSHSNVRVLLHRARLQLMQMLDHYQVTGEC
jgi:RNA polymerase sigma-70 factor, ECF subfamily